MTVACYERRLSGLFWTSALKFNFTARSSDQQIRLEWTTKTLFPYYNRCEVDCVYLISCLPAGESGVVENFPLLLVEYGADLVTDDRYHKDFAKMTCMMSASCLRLARKLVSLNRKPESARIYGLLIGGTRAQLLIAHPIVTKLDEKYDIHVNLSFDPDREINLLSTETELQTASISTRTRPSETRISALSHFSWSRVNINFGNIGQVNVAEQATTKQRVMAVNEEMEMPPSKVLSTAAFAQLSFLNELIQERRLIICTDDESTHESLGRVFMDSPQMGRFPASRASAGSHSPSFRQILGSGAIVVSKIPLPIEYQTIRTGALRHPVFFAQIFDIKRISERQIDYEMELMDPVIQAVSMLFLDENLVPDVYI